MDPITAVGLAGNILQFLQFVGGLLDSTRKLHASITNTSCMNDHVQDICGTLITFNTKLQQSSVSSTDQTKRLSKYDTPLADCAAACRRECEDLLRIMNRLQAIATKGPRFWKSFRAALAEVWKQNEIEDLRSRIADRQRQMTLLLCAASNESIQVLDNHVRNVGRGIWKLQTDSRLDSIINEIRSLKDRVREHDRKEPATADYVSSICAGFSKLSLETHDFEREARILTTLNYADRLVRHEKIPDAHVTTFKWSLEDTEKGDPKCGKLRRWLKTDGSLFWVSGKPGSGKSTFMKWIADNDKTKTYLAAWAGKHELLIISHYFTIHGTLIQRSLEGLLRSLAFGVLVRNPMLIRKLLVDRWETSEAQPSWTRSELGALLKLIGIETDMPNKICYFIDGLDEYDGDHIDICQTLKQLSQSPFIKVCVSSRPWNAFEDALGDKPDSKLYIHELTYTDIRNYTESRLQEHARWDIMQEQVGCASLRSLISEVVAKSNGVFLWVALVVRLLREGLSNDDSISDLQRRLSSFPTDLEEFFKYILQTVDPFYNQKMAATLLLALEAREALRLEIYFFHDFEEADENYVFKESTDLMATDLASINRFRSSMSRRINGRCKGLLELSGYRVEFLHRTVYDFLHTDEMSKFLRDQTRNNHNLSLSILKAFVAWIKRSAFASAPMERCHPLNQIDGFATRLREGLQYARLAETHGESSTTRTAALLDNMERSITQMLSRGQIEIADPSFARDIFRQLVLEAGVGGYIRSKLAIDPDFLTSPYADRFQSPLYFVLSPSCELTPEHRHWILNQLLESGHDPQQCLPDSREIYKSKDDLQQCPVDFREIHKSKTPLDDLFVQVTSDYCQLGPSGSGIDWWWANRPLVHAEGNILLTLLKSGIDVDTVVTVSIRGGQRRMPIWLVLFLAVTRVHSCKRPEAYKETIVAALNRVGPLQVVNVGNLNFWDVCQDWFPLPSETSLSDGDFLVRVFTLVLSKIPAHFDEALAKAKDWIRPVLSADANSRLAAAVASARRTSRCPQKRRHAEDHQEVFEKRKRGRRTTRKKRKIRD